MVGRQLPAVVEFLQRVAGPSAEEAADVRLLRRYATLRDEAAFALLVRRHGPMVLAVCRRMLSRSHDVEDAFQATFLVLARRAASIARPDQLANWLYGVAYRTALKARSLAARRRASERSLDDRDFPAPADPIWPDLAAVLDEEISRLPEKYRSAFVLCYLHGKSTAEVGKVLHCPRGTVLSRLAWARERLRGRLTRRGFALSAAALTTTLAAGAPAAPPASLLAATCSNAGVFTAKTAAAAGVATPAAALATGVLQSMMLGKSKLIVGTALALALVVLPLGLFIRPVPGVMAAPREPADRPPAEVRFGEGHVVAAGLATPMNLDFGELAVGPENNPHDWVSFFSHEGNDGPALAVVFEGGDGKPQSFPVLADATVISYLADARWGQMPWLALDLVDRNRLLLHFDPKLDRKVKKAELVLHFDDNRQHRTPPRPFDVAVHEVKEAWNEDAVTWEKHPSYVEKPSATVRLYPNGKEVRLDVTKLVQRLAEKDALRHGWLLRVAKPLRDEKR
jgi:RNA polymerase sigma factor (sigma-70 family)